MAAKKEVKPERIAQLHYGKYLRGRWEFGGGCFKFATYLSEHVFLRKYVAILKHG